MLFVVSAGLADALVCCVLAWSVECTRTGDDITVVERALIGPVAYRVGPIRPGRLVLRPGLALTLFDNSGKAVLALRYSNAERRAADVEEFSAVFPHVPCSDEGPSRTSK